jgi:eukaryotic-like serine/threonine-protein kinase
MAAAGPSSTTTGCPSDDRIARFVARAASPEEAAAVERHADGCDGCRATLVELARSLPEPADEAGLLTTQAHSRPAASGPLLARGTVIGRFVVLDVVGVGGMGVVYAGYDPELDRKVAIKVLHVVGGGPEDRAAAPARLLREAQAMARVQHENAIAVYEVGTFLPHGGHDDPARVEQVFVAMELIEGRTLRQWMAEADRGWREVVALFVKVGRGLAAAHAAGLVHRDVKPENVLVARDGRVKVTDLGLAAPGRPDGGAAGAGATAPLAVMSQHGGVAGTPAYMAPEQLTGGAVDARSDQFAFCVALYEALFGHRPFDGATLDALAAAIAVGAPRPPTRPRRVPGRIRQLVARGLAADPAARHPSMEALLAALSRAPAQRERRLAVVAAALLVAGGGLAVVQRERPAAAAALCEGAEEHLRGAWDPAVRGAVDAAFRATGAPYASDQVAAVGRLLDGYAGAWVAMREDACRATRVRGEQSDELLDRRMHCLDERLAELRVLTGLFARADLALTERAAAAAAALSPIDACGDAAALMAPVRPPGKGAAAQVQALRLRLAEARAQTDAGRFAEGRAVASAVAAEADALGYDPLRAEALVVRGELEARLGEAAVAERSLEEALLHAEAGGHDGAKADALIRLVAVVGLDAARYDDGGRVARRAEATLTRLGGDDRLLRGGLEHNRGLVLRAAGEYERGAAALERAIALRTEVLGPDHPDVAASVNGLGTVYYHWSKYDEALARYQRALAIREGTLGPRHPDVGKIENNIGNIYKDRREFDRALAHYQRAGEIFAAALPAAHPLLGAVTDNTGLVLMELGRHDEAIDHHRRAREVFVQAHGENHPSVALCLSNLGLVYQSQRRWADALEVHQEALAIIEATAGPDHPDASMAHHNLALDHRGLGDLARAEHHFRRALEIRERAAGPEHLEVARTASNLADLLQRRGRRGPAIALYRRSIAIREVVFGAEHPDLAYDLVRLGEALLAGRAARDAVPVLVRAVAVAERGAGPRVAGEARFALVRARWATGDRRQASVELGRAADAFRAAGAAERLASLERWRAAHGLP